MSRLNQTLTLGGTVTMRNDSSLAAPVFFAGLMIVVLSFVGAASASGFDQCHTTVAVYPDGSVHPNCVALDCSLPGGCIYVNPNPAIFYQGTWTCSCGPLVSQGICNLYFYWDSLGQFKMNCFNPMICPQGECHPRSDSAPPPAPLGSTLYFCECN